jgi:hypothetical protein
MKNWFVEIIGEDDEPITIWFETYPEYKAYLTKIAEAHQ